MQKLQKGLAMSAGLILLTMLVCAFLSPLRTEGNTYQEQEDYLSGWTDESGQVLSLYHVFDKQTEHGRFTRTLDGSAVNGRSLCMITHNILFKVYLDGELLYDYTPELGGILGKRYGEALHTVTIPSFTGEKTLLIEASSLRSDGTSGCNEVYLMDSLAFRHQIESKHGLKLSFCVVAFLFGVSLFFIGMIIERRHGGMIETICLGAITMIVSAWIGSQTLSLRAYMPNPALLRVMEYISLDVLPIPVLLFTASFTKTLKSRSVMVCICLSALKTISTIVGVLSGWFDYSDILIVTHLLILTGVIVIIRLIVRSVMRHEISREKSMYIVSAMSVLMLSGVLDMLRYYLFRSANLAFLTLIGLVIFAMILAVYEYRQVVDMQMRSSKAELMQTLAMEDALTKLGSRAAFVACEKELLSRQDGMCLFVHFDVNYLKRVNDVYGHAEGDRHLIAAANVLRESFGEHGKCFRVGGDEFFVILDGENCRADYETGIAALDEAQQRYNETERPPVPLALAHGMAEYAYSLHNPETAERLADSRMYEHKRSMKDAAESK